MNSRIICGPPVGMEADVYENSVISGLTGAVHDLPEPEGQGRYARPFPPEPEPFTYDRARHRYLARTKSEGTHGLQAFEEAELWDLAERAVWADAFRAGTVQADSKGAPDWERPYSGGHREF